MNIQARSGFTIIEVMLFLAVSGALAIGILVGSSAMIGQQRYRDSVNSFKGLIQEQYGEVTNVINAELMNPDCTTLDETLEPGERTFYARGTSECLLLGKFMLIEPTNVKTYSVVGVSGPSGSNDTDAAILRGYDLYTHASEQHAIHWNARLVQPQTDDDLIASILIVRSPLSGSIVTYVRDGNYLANIRDMIDDENRQQTDFCVDSGGMSGMGSRLAVRLAAKASSHTAVEIPFETEKVCDQEAS